MFVRLKGVLILLLVAILSGCSLAVLPNEYQEIPVYQEPSAPGDFIANVDYATGNIILEWNAVEGASHYTIYYQTLVERNSNETPHHLIEAGTTKSIALSALEADQIYFFQISASNSSNGFESAKSSNIVLSTLSTFTISFSTVGRFAFTIGIEEINYNSVPLVSPRFTFELFEDPDMTIKAKDETGAEFSLIEVDSPKEYSFERILKSNATYYYRAVMYIADTAVQTRTGSFSTAVSNIAPVVQEVVAVSNLNDQVRIDFKIPVINGGLESQVDRRLRVVRRPVGGESSVVFSEENVLEPTDGVLTISENEDGTLACSFYDTDVESGVEYIYEIVSCYYFIADEVVQSGYSVDTERVHPLSVPQLISDKAPTLTVQDEETKLEYKFSIPVYLPFGLSVGSSFIVTYRDITIESPADISVNHGTQGISPNVYALTGLINLTEEEAETSHQFVFTISHKIGDAESSGIETLPLMTQSTLESDEAFFSNFKASSNEGEGVILSWTRGDSIPADVVFTLYRSEGTTVISDENKVAGFSAENNSFIDTGAVPGVTYNYTLRAESNGRFTMETSQGNRLGLVEKLTASQGVYNDRIVVEWNPVANAAGYNVYADGTIKDKVYDPDGDGIWIYEYTDDSDAGRSIEFSVKPFDESGDEVDDGNTLVVAGNILGPYGLEVEASSDLADEILVTWKPIEGATGYNVRIFYELSDGTTAALDSIGERVTGCEYILSSSDTRLDALLSAELENGEGYPLSRSYMFTVTPVHDGTSSLNSSVKVEGSWLQPPKNVTASKAEYGGMTVVSWTPVEGEAYLYRIFRRPAESDESWEYCNVASDGNSARILFKQGDATIEYEYTVASSQDGIIGPVQNCFPVEGQNIGVPLFSPQNIVVSQGDFSVTDGGLVSEKITISFDANEYASSYLISAGSYDMPYEFEVDGETLMEKDGKAEDGTISNGIVTLVVDRPTIQSDTYLSVSIASRNEAGSLSSSTTVDMVPDRYYPVEVVNLVNPMLYRILHEVDSQWDGDWLPYGSTLFGAEKKTFSNSYYYAESVTPAMVVSDADDALIRITMDYEDNGTTMLVNSSLHGTAGSSANPAGENYLTSIRTTGEEAIFVELPYSGVNARIRFTNLNLSGDNGTYLVCIDYNGNGNFDDQEYRVDYSATYTEPF